MAGVVLRDALHHSCLRPGTLGSRFPGENRETRLDRTTSPTAGTIGYGVRLLALAVALWPALPTAAKPAGTKPAGTKPAWTSGTFVFADLCTDSESGTRAGHRVTLRRSPNGDWIVYEGARVPAPVRAGTLSVDDSTKTVAFGAETEAGRVAFHGMLSEGTLIGTLEDEAGSHPVRLPRVLRSHGHEACRGDTTGSVGR